MAVQFILWHLQEVSDEEDFSSSSSSSEDEFYEDAMLVLEMINCRCYYRQRRPRVQNYIENTVYIFNDTDFQQNFRYKKKICVNNF